MRHNRARKKRDRYNSQVLYLSPFPGPHFLYDVTAPVSLDERVGDFELLDHGNGILLEQISDTRVDPGAVRFTNATRRRANFRVTRGPRKLVQVVADIEPNDSITFLVRPGLYVAYSPKPLEEGYEFQLAVLTSNQASVQPGESLTVSRATDDGLQIRAAS